MGGGTKKRLLASLAKVVYWHVRQSLLDISSPSESQLGGPRPFLTSALPLRPFRGALDITIRPPETRLVDIGPASGRNTASGWRPASLFVGASRSARQQCSLRPCLLSATCSTSGGAQSRPGTIAPNAETLMIGASAGACIEDRGQNSHPTRLT